MKLKDWIKILIFVAVCAGLIIGAGFFLAVPEARDVSGMYGFYKEEENSIDVALIGPSPVYTDFYSPLAFEEYGFTSFGVSTGGLSGAMYPSAVREAKQSQNPQVWVIDISGFVDENQYDSAATRRWLDSIQNGPNREQSIKELVSEEDLESYKFPFLTYHANWQRIVGCFKTLIDKIDINSKGYSVTKNFCAYRDYIVEDVKEETYDFSQEGLKSLEEFLEFLKENEIENVLFVRFPKRAVLEDGANLEKGIQLIETAGFVFIDYAVFEGLDVNQDFYDAEHLNVFGTQKFTRVLANYIDDNYELDKDYSEETLEKWGECVSYIPQIFTKTKDQTLARVGQGLYTQRDFLK